MNGQASAIAAYTASEIAPLLAPQFSRRFLPQSVPAWAAQTNFRTLQQQFPDYSFRAVVLNPTNPADLPAPWQAEIIDTLKREPGRKELVTERETPDAGGSFRCRSPIVITGPGVPRVPLHAGGGAGDDGRPVWAEQRVQLEDERGARGADRQRADAGAARAGEPDLHYGDGRAGGRVRW